jgi:putative selenium metabolism hydrolase
MIDSGPCVEFLQRLIRTESLPGQEEGVANLVKDEMLRLGYDDVSRDEAGNIVGLCKGQGQAPGMMFNAHLDHVDVGDPSAWPHPPYDAAISEGKLWGRGAVDIKGPLAAQLYAVGGIISEGIRPAGDVYVTAVVQEEIGGLGARHLVTYLRPPLVVVGEPSHNEIRRGHRGRSELLAHIKGQSVHASIPEKAVNPLEVLANFVLGLKTLQMREDPELGLSTVAPTLLRTDQTSANVTPGEIWLTCDCRTVPGESGADIRGRLQTLIDECVVPGASAGVEATVCEQISYTGLRQSISSEHPSYLLPFDHQAVASAATVLGEAFKSFEDAGVWRFATDGGHFAQAGQTVIGFGPGDDKLAHTVKESIEIAELEKALIGNRALALEWPARNR